MMNKLIIRMESKHLVDMLCGVRWGEDPDYADGFRDGMWQVVRSALNAYWRNFGHDLGWLKIEVDRWFDSKKGT